MNHQEEMGRFVFGMNIADDGFSFSSSIEKALQSTETEIQQLEESIKSIESIRPDCDKLDYALAASAGVLCGIFDIFIVTKPGESPIGDATDEWFAGRTKDFAKLCGWDGEKSAPIRSAIRFLEKKFDIPYDQRGAGDAASLVFGLNPANHHFKSLGHNPTLLGLFFSILDQFTNQSHFVSGGELISLQDADGNFQLRGNNVSAKLFCGFVNWFGHLVSDMSGSSGSKGRGMGIPSPFWSWTNDIIAIGKELNIPLPQFFETLNELALNIYEKGYDIRFQATQLIPVFINETIVRLIYAIRRLFQYFARVGKEDRSATSMWNACEPFSNPTVKRMLTVAHGSFCLTDLGDAIMRSFIEGGNSFDVTEFFLRLNIVGVGRLTLSLYGEAKRTMVIRRAGSKALFMQKEATIVQDYLSGLLLISELYKDAELVDFVDHFKNSDMFLRAFNKSAGLANLRQVPKENILSSKADIDSYFGGKES